MALAEKSPAEALEEARDTLKRNEAAKQSAKLRERGLRQVVRQSERTLESVDRRLRDAGFKRAADA